MGMGWTELIVTLIGIAVSAAIGYGGLRLKSRADTVVQETANQAQDDAAVGRVYGGYDRVITRVEKDNEELRQHRIDDRAEFGRQLTELRTEMRDRLTAVELRCTQDKAELTRKLDIAETRITELLEEREARRRDGENKKVTEKLNGKPTPSTEAP